MTFSLMTYRIYTAERGMLANGKNHLQQNAV
jgi:hypothetical protein